LKTIYAIPGLATNHLLFNSLKINNAQLIVLEWPAPEQGDTMMSYARKFIPQIDQTKEFYLLGVSLGECCVVS